MKSLRHFGRARVLVGAAVTALACTATASAGGDNYQMRLGASGAAAARAVMLTRSDLGSGWTGGPTKPDLSIGSRCPNYKPRLSDLVLNGAAQSTFKQPFFEVDSASQVLQTAKMVRLDWQRSIGSPNYLSCQRAALEKAALGHGRFVSIQRLTVPSIGDFSIGHRVVLDVKSKSGSVRMVVDILAFAKGRTEMALTTTMPVESVPTLWPNEIVFAQLIASRVRA